MIYIFRKEMKKWHTVLWFVLASLVIGGLASIFLRKKGPAEVKIASVNGEDVTLRKYNQILGEIKSQIDAYREYAKAYGISADLFLNLTGLKDPEKTAFDRCVNDALLDQEKSYFKIEIDPEMFSEMLLKMLPAQLKDSSGSLNFQAYKFFLGRSYTTIKDFEANKEEDFKREFFDRCIQKSSYVPFNEVVQNFVIETTKKKFAILVFPFDKFLNEGNKVLPTKAELVDFYKNNKENYRVPEKRQAKYWIMSPEKYAQKIEIDEQTIQNFYDKNKTNLFRIPPKVKVRKILFKISDESTPQAVEKILEKVKGVHKQLVKSPELFEDFVKKYSEDQNTKSKGGIVDFFERGTYDVEFEKAAFRLNNSSEISDIVKTKKGFEIIQLIERVAASEKPLEKVKDEIVKAIKVKREQVVLRSDLEKILHEAKNDENVVAKFAQENNFKENQTNFLSIQDADGKELKNLLAEKLFSAKRQKSVYGYFVHDKDYILYQMSGLQEGFIPSFEQVEKEVLSDYQKNNAKKELKLVVKKAKQEILENKTTMNNLGSRLGLKFFETNSLKNNEEVKSLGLEKDFTQQAFLLEDSRQVLSFKKNSDYYLVQLMQSEKPDMQKFQEEKIKLAEDLSSRENRLYLSTFIASLLRNAKIDKKQEVFDAKIKTTER